MFEAIRKFAVVCLTVIAIILFVIQNAYGQTISSVPPPQCNAQITDLGPTVTNSEMHNVSIDINCDHPYRLFVTNPMNSFHSRDIEVSDHPVHNRQIVTQVSIDELDSHSITINRDN